MEYKVIKSNRKSYAVEIKNGQVIVRVPWYATGKSVADFVRKHEEWIKKHATGETVSDDFFSKQELERLKESARIYFPLRVRYYAELAGVEYGRITIRAQRTRWGSCSAVGNLSFNCVLMLTPEEVRDSVIAHELCHRKEMNHSGKFYEEVLKVYPEYRKWNRWLKQNGKKFICRIPLTTNT